MGYGIDDLIKEDFHTSIVLVKEDGKLNKLGWKLNQTDYEISGGPYGLYCSFYKITKKRPGRKSIRIRKLSKNEEDEIDKIIELIKTGTIDLSQTEDF